MEKTLMLKLLFWHFQAYYRGTDSLCAKQAPASFNIREGLGFIPTPSLGTKLFG